MTAQIIDLVEHPVYRSRKAQKRVTVEMDLLKARANRIVAQADLIAIQTETIWMSALALLMRQQKKEPNDAA